MSKKLDLNSGNVPVDGGKSFIADWEAGVADPKSVEPQPAAQPRMPEGDGYDWKPGRDLD